jgi:hypothetical protein
MLLSSLVAQRAALRESANAPRVFRRAHAWLRYSAVARHEKLVKVMFKKTNLRFP